MEEAWIYSKQRYCYNELREEHIQAYMALQESVAPDKAFFFFFFFSTKKC